MDKTIELDGYRLHLIPTKKFKNITISLKMAAPLTRQTTTLRTLLSFMFTGGTKKYNTSKKFSSYLEDLYGASFSSSIATKGQAHVITLISRFVDEQYLKNEDHFFEKQIQLLHDILFDPNIEEDHFKESVFNQKKQELKWRLQSLKDDKYSYSLERLFQEMGENQTLGISTFGYEEDLDQITSKQLYDYYLQCIQNDKIDLYIVGDLPENGLDIIKNKLIFTKRDQEIASSLIFKSSKTEVKVIEERQDLVQAKLNIGYTIDTDFTSNDHYAFTIFNGILGGFSHSLLFKNVREKNSLCYYISSSYDAFNGIMIINAGIETKNYQKTMDLIREQLETIQKGEFDPSLLDITKTMFENSLKKTDDDALNIIALKYNRDITNKEETNEQYRQKLNQITLDDVIRVSRKVKLDTVYLLAGKE